MRGPASRTGDAGGLLDIIKTGKGQVKDLLEAEKQARRLGARRRTTRKRNPLYNNQAHSPPDDFDVRARHQMAAVASESETVIMALERKGGGRLRQGQGRRREARVGIVTSD